VHEEIAPRNGVHRPWTKWQYTRWIQIYGVGHRKKITRRSWDVIPMPDIVIERVNILGADQPELYSHERLFLLDEDDPPQDDVSKTPNGRNKQTAAHQHEKEANKV
jgi:hypothetical protein